MISIECYKGLPTEYESFLIKRYNSFITNCRYIEVYYSNYDINYLLIFDDQNLIELIIFGNKGNTSTCFNCLAEIDQNIVFEFSKIIFENFSFIRKIEIVASYKEYSNKKTILYSKTNDHILILPATMEEYYLELGYHTRKNIRNRKVRLSRDYSQVNFITKYGDEIEETVIDKIIQLNHSRMKHKGNNPGIDNTYKNKIYRYSKYYGCVAYLEIDGVIAAGCISTIINKEIFLHVIAYDDNYSKYNVGEVCVFNLLQTSIENGISTLHFLWGETELKKRFLAKSHLLFFYYIYKDYSLGYFSDRLNTFTNSIILSIKQSKYSLPFRNAIKSYRKRNSLA